MNQPQFAIRAALFTVIAAALSAVALPTVALPTAAAQDPSLAAIAALVEMVARGGGGEARRQSAPHRIQWLHRRGVDCRAANQRW